MHGGRAWPGTATPTPLPTTSTSTDVPVPNPTPTTAPTSTIAHHSRTTPGESPSASAKECIASVALTLMRSLLEEVSKDTVLDLLLCSCGGAASILVLRAMLCGYRGSLQVQTRILAKFIIFKREGCMSLSPSHRYKQKTNRSN